MRLTRYLLLALVGLFFSLTAADIVFAQSQKGIPSDGRDFYLAQMSSSMDCAAITPFQSYWIVVCSYYDCHVTISYFDQVTGQEIVDHTYPVLAKNFVQIPISQASSIVHDPNTGKNLNIDGEVPEYTAIHVHADRPINVQYFSTGPDDCEMYLALPTSALGKHYVVAAAPNDDGTGGGIPRNCSSQPEPSSSLLGVIAVKDQTHVTIRPSGTTRRGMIPGATSGPNATGTPNTMDVTLQRGQVYWVKSEIKTGPGVWEIDMTGSQVDADQPVAVIGGNENALNGFTALGINDNRNLNLEMMVPYDYWASEGYLVMPMKDTPNLDPNDNSFGDMVKVIVGDKSPANCKVDANLGDLGIRTNDVEPYQFPPVTYNNVDMGSVISSECGQKIFVEQYDYRAIASRSERMATAPTMMNVVPASRFRTSMMWSVPDDVLQVAKFRFINVIANPKVFNKIKLWKDGKPLGSISTLPSAGSTTFPAPYSHLVGRTYALGVGCYYATCDSAFAVYQYGMSAYDYPDKDLGDFDNDDYFHAYATPCGQSFGIDGAGSPIITVDTICDKRPYWMVHVTDTAALDHFISAIDILKDPLGVIKKRPDADSGYTSYNVEFEPTDFTVVPGLYTKDSAKIVVQNPLLKAEAWVWAVNGAGNDTLVHLIYNPPAMQFGAITSTGVDANGDAKLEFKNAQTGVDTCSQFVFKNVSVPGSKPLNLNSLTFVLNQWFHAQAVDFNGNPLTLPIKMAPGDSVIIRICFNTTLAGRVLYDTLLAQTDCPAAIGYVSGSTTLPEITATDYDFGSVVVGDSLCHTVTVTNTGQAKFQLNTQWVKQNFALDDFRFKDSTMLPVTLDPGKSIALNFCFHPSDTVRDSSIVTWGTDISPDRKTVKKNFSILKGLGIKPNLFWTYKDTILYTECDTARTIRAFLTNSGTADIAVNDIVIVPENASDNEWKISGTQTTFPSPLHPKDTTWVDITFTPDLALLKANSWSSDAKIIAHDADGKINPTIGLHASVARADMTVNPTSVDLGVVQPGQMSGTKTVTVKNTGSAPLIIETLTIDQPFSFGSGSIKQWDTILPGKSKDVVVQGQTNDPTATGNLTIKGMTNCAPQAVIPITITTATITPQATGASFNTTYICQNGVQVVSTTAQGQGYKLVLDSVRILPDPAYPTQGSAFIFDSTGGQTLIMVPGDVMQGGDSRSYKVRYTPSSTGQSHARIVYSYHRQDDPTIAWSIDSALTGTGALEKTRLSAAKDPTNSAAHYNAITSVNFSVPIQMLDPISTTAQIDHVTFDLSFTQDQFDPSAGATSGTWLVGANGYTINNQSETDAGGIATLHVTATAPSGGVTTAGTIANLNLQVAVAKTKGSNFVISNAKFYTATDPNAVCYVDTSYIQGTFDPTDICGDSTLRQYLISDKLRFTMDNVRPNPATNKLTVGLDVAQEGTPFAIDMYNAVGEKVRTFATGQTLSAGHQALHLDLTGLPQGAYTVRVTTPGQMGSQMVLIQR